MFRFPTPEQFWIDAITIVVMLGVAFPVHEFAHALAGYRLGDGTAKLMGRLTLNPEAHFDLYGGLLLVISILSHAGFVVGWAKPTPYNPYNLRGGRWGEAIVSVAGPISNFVLAVAASIPLRYIEMTGMSVPVIDQVLAFFVQINLMLMVFNLIPIPPLDGSKVLYAFLDPQTERQVRPVLDQYGMLILIALIFLPTFGLPNIIGAVFGEVINPLYHLLTGL